jgi:hypothetical protein
MADRQIREIQPQEMPLTQRGRQRSLPSQISAALLQPVYFFKTMPTIGETRQWLWVSLLILLLIGFSAVRQEALAPADDSTGGSPTDFVGDFGGDFGFPDEGGDFGGIPGDSGGIPGDFGGVPDVNAPNAGAGGGGNVTETLTTGVIAASTIVVGWILLTILLSEVSLLRGRAPRLGHNFQIAVWSTLPLALMAFLQVLYYAAGGGVGRPGVSGLLDEWEGYASQSPFAQAVLLSFASSITIFWLWKLMMLYFGARFALNGRSWAALLVVVSWMIVSVVTPVVTGEIEIPEAVDVVEPLPDDGGVLPGGEIPFDDPFSAGDGGAGEDILRPDDSPSDDLSGGFSSESTEEASFGGVDDSGNFDNAQSSEGGLEFSTDGNPGSIISEEAFDATDESTIAGDESSDATPEIVETEAIEVTP